MIRSFEELESMKCSCTDALNAKYDGSDGKRHVVFCGGTG